MSEAGAPQSPLPQSPLPRAVFVLEGDHVVPTELARGPWSAQHQHGGAPSALLARAVEHCEPGPADWVARLSIDLVRPVPIAPLQVRAAVTRPGKKVQLVEAALVGDGVDVAICRALRLRRKELDFDAVGRGLPDGVVSPEESEALAVRFPGDIVGFWNAVEMRIARGAWLEPGPATVWFRLAVPLVEGEQPTPLQRVAAAADFGNGVSSSLDRARFSFINPDLHVFLHRPPAGEWVGLDGVTFAEPSGVGLADCGLLDERGRIGRSVQDLLLDEL